MRIFHFILFKISFSGTWILINFRNLIFEIRYLSSASSIEKFGFEDAGEANSIKTNNTEAIEQQKSSREYLIVFLYFIVIDIFTSCLQITMNGK